MDANAADDRRPNEGDADSTGQGYSPGPDDVAGADEPMVVDNELDELGPADQAGDGDTVDSDAPELVESRRIRIKSWSERSRTIGITVGVAALFAVAGYWIHPRLASSAPEKGPDLVGQVRDELKRTVVAEKKLQTELAAAKGDLETTAKQLAEAREAETAAKEKVEAAETSVADLSAKLEEARTAGEPMALKLEAAEKSAAETKAAAATAAGKVETLQKDLTAAVSQRDALEAEQCRLTETRKNLETAASSQQQRQEDLIAFLAVLDLGSTGGRSPVAAAPGEMPITAKELVQRMGAPTVTFEREGNVAMEWGKDHSAVAKGDIVVTIDGQPASRTTLGQVATRAAEPAAPVGAWRVSGEAPLRYSDLVEMFGPPERVGGTGMKFTAWWPAGAWGRQVSATVEEGIVQAVDGGPVEPGKVCALVSHRLVAYAEATPAVKNNAERAKAAYRQATEAVTQRLTRQAELRRRDGQRLAEWKIAPLDSVGAWVGPSDAHPRAWTVRAAVDETWRAGDGTATVERRYVVVTVQETPQGAKTLEYAMVAPRD